MVYRLGTTVTASGCLTRLIDVVDRSPTDLEDLIGFYRGRLARGFSILLLKQSLGASDFEFFGYTYMSGGRFGLPSNVASIDRERPKVDERVRGAIAAGDLAPDFYEKFASKISLQGVERYVKIVSAIGHDDTMLMADQYPASMKGVAQLNLKKDRPKTFLVAAEVSGSIWTLADSGRTKLDVAARPRYDLPYSNDPRKKVTDFLAWA
jgi:hypothetical protein